MNGVRQLDLNTKFTVINHHIIEIGVLNWIPMINIVRILDRIATIVTMLNCSISYMLLIISVISLNISSIHTLGLVVCNFPIPSLKNNGCS